MLRGARSRPPIVAGRGSAPEEDIAELVQAARHGDATAFTYLYRRHVDRVYDYAARRLPDTHAAEEVTQEVFYRAFRGIAGCREAHLFPGWLFGIARHVIADLYRAPRPIGPPWTTTSIVQILLPLPRRTCCAPSNATHCWPPASTVSHAPNAICLTCSSPT